MGLRCKEGEDDYHYDREDEDEQVPKNQQTCCSSSCTRILRRSSSKVRNSSGTHNRIRIKCPSRIFHTKDIKWKMIMIMTKCESLVQRANKVVNTINHLIFILISTRYKWCLVVLLGTNKCNAYLLQANNRNFSYFMTTFYTQSLMEIFISKRTIPTFTLRIYRNPSSTNSSSPPPLPWFLCMLFWWCIHGLRCDEILIFGNHKVPKIGF